MKSARPRLARVLRNLAARLERGEKLETAIAAQGSRLPAHLRGLIVAGVRSGRLPIVLDQFAALARRQQDLRRRVLLALAYPALLLGIMAALMVFCHLLVTKQFSQIFRDFNTKLPDITMFYFQLLGRGRLDDAGTDDRGGGGSAGGPVSAAGGLAGPRDVRGFRSWDPSSATTAMPSSRTSWPSCWKRKSRCPRPCG